jgi:hypothetical protein
MKLRIITIAFLLLSTAIAHSASLQPYEKGQLTGSLGFGAMTIDAYYEICYSKGLRTDNNLKGINKLLKDEWGFTFTEVSTKEEERTGRNFRKEAHTLVHTARKKTGGCNSDGMEQWFRKFQEIHENNLSKFHSVQ